MFLILGYLLSLICVFGVFILHGGKIGVVLEALPFEMATIGGAAVGAFIVNNQPKVIKATLASAMAAIKPSKYTKARYMELMTLLYDILQKARKEGLMAIEADVEEPHESEIFKKYPNVGTDHHVVEFMTDYLRMMVSGNLNSHEIEALILLVGDQSPAVFGHGVEEEIEKGNGLGSAPKLHGSELAAFRRGDGGLVRLNFHFFRNANVIEIIKETCLNGGRSRFLGAGAHQIRASPG